MSINGSDVLSQIESRRSAVNAEMHSRGRKLAGLRDAHSRAANQLQQAYLTITQARTENAGEQRRGLSEVDGWLAQQDAARRAEGVALGERVAKARAEVDASRVDVQACTTELSRAQGAWDDARRTMRDALTRDNPEFIAALQRQADAVRRSQAVDEHLQEMSTTTKAFTQACNADPLFAYCAKRRVGVNGCEGNFLTRSLDRLVARVAGYYKHRQMLMDAEADLQQWVRHQALLHAELSDAQVAVEKRIDASLRSQTGIALVQALSLAKSKLDTATRRKEHAAAELSLLASQKSEFDQGRDARAVQMRQRVMDAITHASIQDLARAAAETAPQADDEAAALVADLRSVLPDLEEQISEAGQALAEVEEQNKRLDSLVSRFRSEGYDRRYSRFDYGFNTDTLVAGVLLGQMSVGQAMGQCQSAHRDVTPPPPPSHSSSSSSGGFSSGGGFGGGGGFSTGGGF